MAAAEAALKIAPTNREANRVLGTVYAALSESTSDPAGRGRGADAAEASLAKAIRHFELALEGAVAESDPNVRATLARLYVRSAAFDKAIPLLTDLVNQEPGWQDGPLMLVEAYAGAGRSRDAIAWLEERTATDPRLLPALADFYDRERRFSDAAGAYARALQRAPRNATDLKTRYASALMNAGGRDNIEKARATLTELVAARANDVRALYLLSQAQRRLGDFKEAEASARRYVAQNDRSPWGYYALAEALEARRQYQAVVDELAPVVAANRGKTGDQSMDISILLPHLGFAYQETGQADKAIAVFEEARRLAPDRSRDRRVPDRGEHLREEIRRGDRRGANRRWRSIRTICGSRGCRRRRCATTARPMPGSRCWKRPSSSTRTIPSPTSRSRRRIRRRSAAGRP